jgi:hypothetical protein
MERSSELPKDSKSLQIQKYVMDGDYDGLEQEFPGTSHPELQPALNWALVYTIKNALSSTNYLQNIQMLFAKGASLNTEDDSKVLTNHRCHSSITCSSKR